MEENPRMNAWIGFDGLPGGSSASPRKPASGGVQSQRRALRRAFHRKWLPGAVLRYGFFHGHTEWDRGELQKQVVRDAFRSWSRLGIGVRFDESRDAEDAEIRIGFDPSEPTWSCVGRSALAQGPLARTANIGFDLGGPEPEGREMAFHQVGHALGFTRPRALALGSTRSPESGRGRGPSRLASPFAPTPGAPVSASVSGRAAGGAVAVLERGARLEYRYPAVLGPGAPSFWDPERQLDIPLSESEQADVRRFYPAVGATDVLTPLSLRRLALAPGDHVTYSIQPSASRVFRMRTFGEADVVMSLVRADQDGRTIAWADDGCTDRNSEIAAHLEGGRTYSLSVRMCWMAQDAEVALLLW